MIKRFPSLVSGFVVLLSLCATLAQAAEVTGLQLVSSVRSGRTSMDYTYRINVRNDATPLSAALATVRSTAAATTVLDGTVSLGDLAAGATLLSTDTFTIRQDRTAAFNPASLSWSVTGVLPNAPASLQVQLSEPVVAPDGSVTISPVLLNSSGEVIDDSAAQFTLSVAPVGVVFGNAPVVSGMSVSFPKLVKRLINLNPSTDPEGLYADADPTDPNYGKETGGTYRVTVRLAGSTVSGSADVRVLPSGTAGITLKSLAYADALGTALELAQQAVTNRDALLLTQARSSLAATKANPDFSQTVLGTNNVLAPADGQVPTLAQLSARGLVAGAQDAQYTAAMATVLQRIRDARTALNALNVSSLSQASVDTLASSITAYKQALQTLQSYKLSAYGTVQQQAAIQQQLAVEIPLLLDAIKSQSDALLTVVTMAGAPAPTLAAFKTKDLGLLGRSTPLSMYAQTRPVQWATYFTMWSSVFSMVTDLKGAARTNIAELSLSLVSTLINIQAAEVVNRTPPGAFFIDYVYASSSTAAMCPNYRPTRIIGTGLGDDPNAYRVVVVGCISSDVLSKLITQTWPKDVNAYIRLANKVVSIGYSLSNQGGVASVQTPSAIMYDDIGFDEYMLYFPSGWPRVNQSRLPCSGLVVVMDLVRGGMQAFTPMALPSCG